MVWEPAARMLSPGESVEVIRWDEAMDGELRSRLLNCGEDFLLCGWSMGGQLVLKEAAEFRTRVRGVFLVSSMVSLTNDEFGPGIDPVAPSRIARMLNRNRKAFFRVFFEDCLAPSVDDGLLKELQEEAETFTTRKLLEGLRFMNGSPSPPPEGIPMMILHGREDLVIPFRCSSYIAEETPGSSMEIVPGGGHLLPLTDSGKVGRRLVEFCKLCTA
jgi:pimeloyl-ACP methyl ester carboxylesterase